MGTALAFGGYGIAAYIAAVAASVGLFVSASRIPTGYASLTVIFVVFFLAYGLLAPLGAFAGLRVFFPPPYETDQFVAHYCLACAGLVLGVSEWRGTDGRMAPRIDKPNLNSHALLVVAFVFAGTATAFEVINVVRAGGVEILLAGKLAYQTAVTELMVSLPAEYAARSAVAVFALWFVLSRRGYHQSTLRNLIVFLVLIAPVIAGFVVLGRRTEILAILLIAIVAGSFFSPVHSLTRRMIVGVVVLYVGFIVIFVLRETVFHHSAGQMTIEKFQAAILHVLFPVSGEFGAPFSVFSEGIKRFSDDPLMWGGSYLDGFALMVPSFMYPGDKPVQLDAALFALANPGGTAHLGSAASFGYSPLLEAFVNFGPVGVFIVFAVIGFCLKLIERMRFRCGAFAFVMVYLLVLPIGQTFHRSTFGNAVISPGLWIAIAVVSATIIYHLSARLVSPASSKQP